MFRKLLLSCRLLLCCLYSSNVSGGRYSSALSVSLQRPARPAAVPKHTHQGRERDVVARPRGRNGSRTEWPAGRRCRRPSASTARECPRAAAGTAQCRRFRPGSRTGRQSPPGTGARDAVSDNLRGRLDFTSIACTMPGSPRPAPGGAPGSPTAATPGLSAGESSTCRRWHWRRPEREGPVFQRMACGPRTCEPWLEQVGQAIAPVQTSQIGFMPSRKRWKSTPTSSDGRFWKLYSCQNCSTCTGPPMANRTPAAARP